MSIDKKTKKTNKKINVYAKNFKYIYEDKNRNFWFLKSENSLIIMIGINLKPPRLRSENFE